MNTQEIVSKLWNLCNVLRDDGITYHQYVTELTYILFLKMAKETGAEEKLPEAYRWDILKSKSGIELKTFYKELLNHLGEETTGRVQQIYQGSSTNIEEPKNLEKIITTIDGLDWYSAKEEGLGNLYEGLLEKNASEKKSGAGQYFTPRVLIDVMVKLVDPKPGEKCNDPAAGTFGFMIAADHYLKEKTDNYFDLDTDLAEFQRTEAFSGCELVHETHRLALMNAMLHDIEGNIILGDTLTNVGKQMKDLDVVLSNPPFGTKKGGERATRDDLTFMTSNKQLNFLQHIYRSLKADGKARAAVVLPDNVLFDEQNNGIKIRQDLMDKCNLHTILRLPKGIFYAKEVKTNVLFFTRGTNDKENTSEVWVYDMRTNIPNFGKRNSLKHSDFNDFINAYTARNREAVDDERWNKFTRSEIVEKGYLLDLGLIKDESIVEYEDLPDPKEASEEAIDRLEEAIDLLKSVMNELKSLENKENN